MQAALHDLHVDTSSRGVDELFHDLDLDQNGGLDLYEFKRALKAIHIPKHHFSHFLKHIFNYVCPVTCLPSIMWLFTVKCCLAVSLSKSCLYRLSKSRLNGSF